MRKSVSGNEMKESRRDFVKKFSMGMGAAAFGAPAVLSAASRTRLRYRENRLGIALVGLGVYSNGQLGPAFQYTDSCYLAGIVTGTPEKETEWMEAHGIPRDNVYNYDNYDEIADNDDIDIIYIVLPNGMHAEYTIRGANAGKHMIVEKPMSNTVEEAEQMIAACEENNVKMSIGYRLHFDPFNQEMMRLGQEQVFGRVKLVEANLSFTMREGNIPPHWEWRLNKELAGGGALYDLGVYSIQAARYVTGEEPIAVTAQEYKTNPRLFSEVDETILFQFEFPSGAIANCGSSYNMNRNILHTAADRGMFELSPAYSYSGLQGRTHEGPMEIESVNQQAAQMDDFAVCIMEGRESRVSGEEGLRDMKIMEAIYQAVDSGSAVPLDHA